MMNPEFVVAFRPNKKQQNVSHLKTMELKIVFCKPKEREKKTYCPGRTLPSAPPLLCHCQYYDVHNNLLYESAQLYAYWAYRVVDVWQAPTSWRAVLESIDYVRSKY